MVSVNEQSLPILDVKHGPIKNKKMHLTVVLDPVPCSKIIFLRNI